MWLESTETVDPYATQENGTTGSSSIEPRTKGQLTNRRTRLSIYLHLCKCLVRQQTGPRRNIYHTVRTEHSPRNKSIDWLCDTPGWDLARIRHLCIGISIVDHEGQGYHECSFTMQHPARSRYEDLGSQQLTSLRAIRLFVAVTTYDGPVSYPYHGNVRFSPPPAPDPDHVLSEQLYRYFLHLPFPRLRMMFGLDDQCTGVGHRWISLRNATFRLSPRFLARG
jgi:hypothetical protein